MHSSCLLAAISLCGCVQESFLVGTGTAYGLEGDISQRPPLGSGFQDAIRAMTSLPDKRSAPLSRPRAHAGAQRNLHSAGKPPKGALDMQVRRSYV